MSSKSSRSIASELVFLFAPAAALLLFSALAVFYWMVVRHAFEEDNAVLADKVFALRAQLREVGGPQPLTRELDAPGPGEHAPYWVRVLDSGGRTAAETPGMGAVLPADVFPRGATEQPSKPKDYHAAGKLFSLVTVAAEAGGQPYTIQVAQDRSADADLTRELGTVVAAVLACGVLASILIGITVTKRGLRPLADLTRSLERVGPTRLHERVPPAGWPAELQPLVGAFDRMLDRLEESFTRLSQFSADLAHELRTPIANIRGEAEVALTRPRTADEYREVIDSTVAECERLSGIIDNLLFLARAEAADRQIQPTLSDGRAALEKIAGYYRTLAEERHITITCDGAGEVYADPVLFGRAVSNLVDNALRFTPDGGEVTVAIRSSAAAAEISVRDNGAGIAPEHLPHVFARFYRADPSRNSSGTGLGLALVKSITDLHGGTAEIASAVSRGTTVTLNFPAPVPRSHLS
jgi:two-component system heavy metal sensor histidine kinase CusS